MAYPATPPLDRDQGSLPSVLIRLLTPFFVHLVGATCWVKYWAEAWLKQEMAALQKIKTRTRERTAKMVDAVSVQNEFPNFLQFHNERIELVGN